MFIHRWGGRAPLFLLKGCCLFVCLPCLVDRFIQPNVLLRMDWGKFIAELMRLFDLMEIENRIHRLGGHPIFHRFKDDLS